MHRSAFLFFAILFFECSGTSSDSRVAEPAVEISFQATTPSGETIKKMLGITTNEKVEMMRWDLTLNKDPKDQKPTTFRLIYEYGEAKQGTRGFKEGSKKVELKGNWVIEKGIPANPTAMVITLNDPGANFSLSLVQADENILHLLDQSKQLLVGSAAWSYTLNRKDPVSQKKFVPVPISSLQISSNEDTVGIFEGRTPCNQQLSGLHDLSTDGCQVVKCQLILLQNVKDHTPSTFILKTIYVGKGDNKYSVTGNWKMMRRSINDATAVVYQLNPEPNKSNSQLLLLKTDDNILFFIDNDGRLRVGNNYCSYTLNRKK